MIQEGQAIAAVIAEGSVRTYDMGRSSTFDMARAVKERYSQMIGE